MGPWSVHPVNEQWIHTANTDPAHAPSTGTGGGLRIAPLRFENDKGYVSALETGFGLGPYKGRCLEVSILSVGIRLQGLWGGRD